MFIRSKKQSGWNLLFSDKATWFHKIQPQARVWIQKQAKDTYLHLLISLIASLKKILPRSSHPLSPHQHFEVYRFFFFLLWTKYHLRRCSLAGHLSTWCAMQEFFSYHIDQQIIGQASSCNNRFLLLDINGFHYLGLHNLPVARLHERIKQLCSLKTFFEGFGFLFEL